MLYHGGAPGFRIGDVIEPHETKHIDGCEICAARADENHQPDHVFATPIRIYAKYYASKYIDGSLYLVEPVGACERSEADSIETYQAPAFRVVKVSEVAVRLTMSERRHLYRIWETSDRSAGFVESADTRAADRAIKQMIGMRAPSSNRRNFA